MEIQLKVYNKVEEVNDLFFSETKCIVYSNHNKIKVQHTKIVMVTHQQ